MKKVWLLCCLVIMVVSLSACSMSALFNSIPFGYTDSVEHWDKEGFQDYTDYCKYIYSSEEKFSKSSAYSKITEKDIERVCGCFDNFRECMEQEDRLDEYDFQNEYINTGDYVKIIDKGGLYENYDVYFFDVETLTLYYIHSNI